MLFLLNFQASGSIRGIRFENVVVAGKIQTGAVGAQGVNVTFDDWSFRNVTVQGRCVRQPSDLGVHFNAEPAPQWTFSC